MIKCCEYNWKRDRHADSCPLGQAVEQFRECVDGPKDVFEVCPQCGGKLTYQRTKQICEKCHLIVTTCCD